MLSSLEQAPETDEMVWRTLVQRWNKTIASKTSSSSLEIVYGRVQTVDAVKLAFTGDVTPT